jgi:hypothetical protein
LAVVLFPFSAEKPLETRPHTSGQVFFAFPPLPPLNVGGVLQEYHEAALTLLVNTWSGRRGYTWLSIKYSAMSKYFGHERRRH